MTILVGKHINLHMFFEMESEEEAKLSAASICDHLTKFGETSASQVKQYWKMPEYFEVRVEVHNERLGQGDIARIASEIGGPWMESGSSLIWNFGEGARFIDGKVRWANMEYIE